MQRLGNVGFNTPTFSMNTAAADYAVSAHVLAHFSALLCCNALHFLICT